MSTNETKAQHTPGPWQVMGYIRPHGKRYLHMTEVTLDSGANRPKWSSSADQNADPDRFHTVAYGAGLTYEESQANARLIASAPELEAQRDELLEVCKRIILLVDSGLTIQRDDWDAARAAIARAETGYPEIP